MSDHEKPERWKPFKSMKLEPEVQADLEAEYGKILEVIGRWHDDLAWGRKGQLAKELGVSLSCIADVVGGRRSITVDRLLGFLSKNNSSLHDLVKATEPDPSSPLPLPQLPRPFPAEQLVALVQREPKYLRLSRWAPSVILDDEGHALALDVRLIMRQAEFDPARARRMAEQHLNTVGELSPGSLSRSSASNLCRVIAYLAGPRYQISDTACDDAAELLSIASVLDEKLEMPHVRALLYRRIAFLMCYLGKIVTASRCAQAAVDLSIVDPKGGALGKSLYVNAWIAKWRGATSYALQLMRSAQDYLSDPAFATVVRSAIIYFLIDLGEFREASEMLEAEPLDGASPPIRGRLHFYQAILQSVRGSVFEAEENFEAAENLLDLGNATDRALYLLHRCVHLARHGLLVELEKVSAELPRLATHFRSGSSGEAAIFEAKRLCLVGGAACSQNLIGMIQIVERPWSPRATTVQDSQPSGSIIGNISS